MTVFLVDDSPQVIDFLKEMLAALPGIEVAGHAHDVSTALRSIRTASPDVVLLDLHLPDGSGMEVLKTIKKEMPATIVIVLTNYAFPQYKQKCLEMGAHAFLDKSTDFTKIPRLISDVSEPEAYRQGPPSSPTLGPPSQHKIREGSR
jgi:DNA-binding NarL/FixJ family response regulator